MKSVITTATYQDIEEKIVRKTKLGEIQHELNHL